MLFVGTTFSQFVSDFDQMLDRKKAEEGSRKRGRKRKDGDIINDNDDLIVELVQRMKLAAEVSNSFTTTSDS